MTNFEKYKELIFHATEDTDKAIYQEFLNYKHCSAKIIPQGLKSTYDVMQISDNSNDMIELKTRWKYTYDQFDDISINLWKTRRLLELKEDAGANNIYFCIFYPKDDKVVLIDITHLEYDESDIRKKLEDKDIRLQSVSDYLMIPDESKNHLYIINYSNLDMENIGQIFDEIYDIAG